MAKTTGVTPKVEAHRVQRWFEILVEMDLDQAIQAVLEAQRAAAAGKEVNLNINIDVGKMVGVMAREGRILEMVHVLTATPLEEAGEYDMLKLGDDAALFFAASTRLFEMLLGFVNVTA